MKLWQKWWFWLILLIAFGAVINLIYAAIGKQNNLLKEPVKTSTVDTVADQN